MAKRFFVAGFIVALAGIIVAGQQSTSKQAIQGVWRVVETSRKAPSTYASAGTNSNPQPGVWVFTGKHFSYVDLNTDKPRPDLPDAAKATADELRAVWGPLAAQAGTYEITNGGVLAFRPIVAKNPANMKAGASTTWSYRLEGNSLWATQQSGLTGPIANPITLKFTRLE